MPPQIFMSYGTLSPLGLSFPFMRGVTPSVCTLLCQPQDNLDIPPGDLSFGVSGGQSMTFINCAVRSCNIRLRKDGRPLMAVQVMDRRWKWASGSISGVYNDHLQGTAALKSAKDLMFLCLVAMGELNADLGGAPTGVFPYVNWNNTRPDLALADLCERCACEVVLNPLTDKAEIWQLGVGQTSPINSGELHPKYRFTPRSYTPSSIEVHGGPSLLQYRLAMEGVARGSNLVQSASPDWLGTGVSSLIESFNWPSVTDTVKSELALATGWRQYRVKGQEGGGLNVPGLAIAIASTNQYELQDFILYTAYDDRTGQYQKLPYYIEGDFWPYGDLPTNTSNTVYLGASTLYKERNLVEFPFPLVKLDASGYIGEATLYLQTAYKVKDAQGNYAHVLRSGNVGGSGGKLILKRPECFAAYASTGNTESIINAELDAYVQLFTQKYSNATASELTYAGILTGTLDGNIAQATWSIRLSRGPTTRVCEVEELDTSAPGREERRRRERLQKIVEAA
jgi:hypothetical protein